MCVICVHNGACIYPFVQHFYRYIFIHKIITHCEVEVLLFGISSMLYSLYSDYSLAYLACCTHCTQTTL